MTNKDSGKKSLSEQSANNTGSMTNSDQWLEESLRAHLDAQAENLDFNVTSKLSAARHRALAQEHSPEHNNNQTRQSNTGSFASWLNWTNALGSTAVVALAIFIGTQIYPTSNTENNGLTNSTMPVNEVAQQTLMEDLNLLSAADDIEFFQNVEFLEWMESNSS